MGTTEPDTTSYTTTRYTPHTEQETQAEQEAADARALARRTRGHVTSYGQGRVCAAPGCDTKLSRYNTTSRCWTHDDSKTA